MTKHSSPALLRITGWTAAILILILGAGTSTVLMQSTSCFPSNIKPSSASFGANGGSGSFTFTATAPYGSTCMNGVFSGASWITPILTNGTGGGTVNFTVAPNTSTSPRTASIAIGATPTLGATFPIAQAGSTGTPAPLPAQPPLLLANPSSLSFGSVPIPPPSTGTGILGGVTRVLTVSSPRYPTTNLVVQATSNNAAFTISPSQFTIPAGGTGTTSVTFTPNAVGFLRTTITLQAYRSSSSSALRVPNAAQPRVVLPGPPVGGIGVDANGTGTGTPERLSITTTSLPSDPPGAGFLAKVEVRGGFLPYTYSVDSALPTGLRLDTKTGEITGAAPAGNYNFVVTATDFTGVTARQLFSGVIAGATFPNSFPALTLAPGATGATYIPQFLTATGPDAVAVTYALGPSFPPGMTLDANGIFSGTPTDPTGTPYHFQVQALRNSDNAVVGRGAYDLAVVNPVITRIVDGGAWRTTLTLVNLGTQPANFPIVFRNTDGTPLSLPFVGIAGTPSTVPVSIPVGGSVTLTSNGLPGSQTVVGSAELRIGMSDQVGGTAVFKQTVAGRPDFEAAVPVSARFSARVLLPFDNTSVFTTVLAATNPSDTPVTTTYRARAESGIMLSSVVHGLGARNHEAFGVRDVFAGTGTSRGTLEVTTTCGSVPCPSVSLFGLRANDNGSFSSFTSLIPDELLLPLPANNFVTVPRISDGGDTWKTTITLVNLGDPAIGDTTANVGVKFWDEGGAPLSISVLGLPASGVVAIPLLGSVTLETNGVPIKNGWVELQPGVNDKVGGIAIFRQRIVNRPDLEATVPVTSRVSNRLLIPFDHTNNFGTSIAVTNPNPNGIVVTMNIRDESGAAIQTVTLNIAAKASSVFGLADNFMQSANRRGVVEFTTPDGGPGFALFALRANPTGSFTSLNPLSTN